MFAEAVIRALRSVWSNRLRAGAIPVVQEGGAGVVLAGLDPSPGSLIVGTESRWTVLAGGPGQIPQGDADGLRFGPAPLKTLALSFGGNVNSTAARWLIANGAPSETIATASGSTTRAAVPFDCTLRRVIVATGNNAPRIFVDVGGSPVATVYRNGVVWGSTNYDRVFMMRDFTASVPAGTTIEVRSEGANIGITRVVLLLSPDPVAARGWLLPYGATFASTGTHAIALGTPAASPVGSAGTTTRLPGGYAGALTHLAFARATIASNTVLRVHNLTASTSADASLPSSGTAGTVAVSLAGAAGDAYGVEFLSGTAPGATWIGLCFRADAEADRTGYVDWFGGNPSSALQATANYVPMAIASASLATGTATTPAGAGSLCPRAGATYGDEGQGGILRSILGAAPSSGRAAVQVGSAVRRVTIPGSGSFLVDHEGGVGDVAMVNPDEDLGDTIIGLHWS